MLLLFWKKEKEFLLPKGRKNIEEGLEDVAIRETYEETGVRVSLLPCKIPTLATPRAVTKPASELNTEAFAFTQRDTNDGKLKLIFWYIGEGDSNAEPVTGTQEEGEDFDPVWMSFEQAVQALTYSDDKEVAGKAIQLLPAPDTRHP